MKSAPPVRLELNASGRDSALGSPVTVGLATSFCRCTGYVNVLHAVAVAQRAMGRRSGAVT